MGPSELEKMKKEPLPPPPINIVDSKGHCVFCFSAANAECLTPIRQQVILNVFYRIWTYIQPEPKCWEKLIDNDFHFVTGNEADIDRNEKISPVPSMCDQCQSNIEDLAALHNEMKRLRLKLKEAKIRLKATTKVIRDTVNEVTKDKGSSFHGNPTCFNKLLEELNSEHGGGVQDKKKMSTVTFFGLLWNCHLGLETNTNSSATFDIESESDYVGCAHDISLSSLQDDPEPDDSVTPEPATEGVVAPLENDGESVPTVARTKVIKVRKRKLNGSQEDEFMKIRILEGGNVQRSSSTVKIEPTIDNSRTPIVILEDVTKQTELFKRITKRQRKVKIKQEAEVDPFLVDDEEANAIVNAGDDDNDEDHEPGPSSPCSSPSPSNDINDDDDPEFKEKPEVTKRRKKSKKKVTENVKQRTKSEVGPKSVELELPSSKTGTQFCEVCKETVPIGSGHLRTHIGNWVHSCPNPSCGRQYLSRFSEVFRKHIELNKRCFKAAGSPQCYKRKGKIPCDVCGKELKPTQVPLHFKTHETAEKNFDCPLQNLGCQLKFTTKQSVEFHLRTHNKSSPENQQCLLCTERDRISMDPSEMEGHLRTVHNIDQSQIFKCLYCGFTYSDGSMFVEHCMKKCQMKEERQTSLKCDLCEERIPRKWLRKHFFKVHHIGDKIQCQYCEFSCFQKVYLEDHERTAHEGKGTKFNYTCNLCDPPLKYKSSFNLRQHKISVHSTIPDPVTCHLCPEKFATYAMLSKHRYRKHPKEYPRASNLESSTSVTCEVCDKILASKQSYERHRESHYTEEKYICDHEDCGQKFLTKYALERHVKFEHFKLMCQCEECGRQFKDTKYLALHRLVHTKEQPYKCSICEKGFSQRSNIATHLRSHITKGESFKPRGKNFKIMPLEEVKKMAFDQLDQLFNNPEEGVTKRVICTVCCQTFVNKQVLNIHMESTHPESVDGKTEKVFKCDQCTKEYFTRKGLLDHTQNYHSGERKRCEPCGKEFTVSALSAHIRTVHFNVKFACSVCHKEYKSRQMTKIHISSQHEGIGEVVRFD